MNLPMTLLRSATATLEAGGVPRPRWTAEQLLAHSLNCKPIELYLGATPIDLKQEAQFFSDVAARASGVPLQYLLETAEFYGREFSVGPGVFIPRPETEVLIDVVCEVLEETSSPLGGGVLRPARQPLRGCLAKRLPSLSPPERRAQAESHARSGNRIAFEPHPPSGAPASSNFSVVDVGTGCGAIGITLALECPGIQVVATDRSAHPLPFARRNAHRHEAAVSFLEGDLLEPLAGQSVDLIAANLPYLDPEESSGWPRELNWEPWIALDGGEHGLSLIRRLIRQAAGALKPGGNLVLEIGDGQASPVGSCAQTHGFRLHQVVQDLAGLERVVVLWKS